MKVSQWMAGICLLAPGGFPPGSGSRPALRPVPAGASDADTNAVHRRNLELMMIGDPKRIDDLTVAMQRRNCDISRWHRSAAASAAIAAPAGTSRPGRCHSLV